MNHSLTQISQITDHIFLSGIYPLQHDVHTIKNLNIKYIVCCVDRNSVQNVHNLLLKEIPDLTILYVPYDDVQSQNLWETNKNSIDMIRYAASSYDQLLDLFTLYQNKPLIEIGYHFINWVMASDSNSNVLVHCMAGMSRSVSMVIYFLMKKYGLSYFIVLSVIKRYRPIASPNKSFSRQLIQYQIYREKFTVESVEQIISQIKNSP